MMQRLGWRGAAGGGEDDEGNWEKEGGWGMGGGILFGGKNTNRASVRLKGTQDENARCALRWTKRTRGERKRKEKEKGTDTGGQKGLSSENRTEPSIRSRAGRG